MCMVLGQSHGHSQHKPAKSKDQDRQKKSMENINVRAAFIHVIGDLIQSIGVVIAGYIIWIWVRQSCWGGGGAHVTWCSVLQPEAKLADPICTFLFCILVLFSTFSILKDALRVVMEGIHVLYMHMHMHMHMHVHMPCPPSTGTPKHIDYEEVKADLCAVEGVRQAHSLHIWSLTLNRTALAAHLVLGMWVWYVGVVCGCGMWVWWTSTDCCHAPKKTADLVLLSQHSHFEPHGMVILGGIVLGLARQPIAVPRLQQQFSSKEVQAALN